MKAIWEGYLLAESENTVLFDNNHYFPASSLNMDYFIESKTTTTCSWKGTASYYTIVVSDKENKDAAWYYPSPKEAASEITDYVAFWRGVEVKE